jgi:hypothetical protein
MTMDTANTIAVWVVIVTVPLLFLFAIWVFVSSFLAGRQRRRVLADVALANGWSYKKTDARYETMWDGPPFRIFGGDAKDVFEGTWGPTGQPFVAFDYSYSESAGRSSYTVHWEVRALRLARALPSLSITREDLGTKAAKVFGAQDIEFESDDFNRAFRVTSDDTRFAYGIITPGLMEWLLGPGGDIVPLRIDGDYLITYDHAELHPKRFTACLDAMSQLVGQISPNTWEAYGR